ncbi:hypothetical protein B0H14DRAFT_3853157 [Mycena olivaceomarginata]|nr:hypothetical protein B0H14DRAFT_3853157 [Mycena olivaceomarginata]
MRSNTTNIGLGAYRCSPRNHPVPGYTADADEGALERMWCVGEQCWYGWTKDVAPTVVPLETCYFTSVVGKFLGLADAGSKHCGCAVGGVGCAVCGNPLGTLQTVCATRAITAKRDVYLFLASAVSPAPHAEMSWIGETSPPTRARVAARLHTAVPSPCGAACVRHVFIVSTPHAGPPPECGAAFRDGRVGRGWHHFGCTAYSQRAGNRTRRGLHSCYITTIRHNRENQGLLLTRHNEPVHAMRGTRAWRMGEGRWR